MLKKVLFIFVAVILCPLWLAADDWKVAIREWDVPTPKSWPHDPEVAPDGTLWYTGQLASKLGRLDPNTGAIKEFPLKTPDSGPHGLRRGFQSPNKSLSALDDFFRGRRRSQYGGHAGRQALLGLQRSEQSRRRGGESLSRVTGDPLTVPFAPDADR